MSRPNEESFLKNVAQHQMTIVLDNGLHRHLQFAKPKSSDQHFHVVTWPGYLAYTGDMGAYVFQRLPDMFEFFRSDRHQEGRLGVNPHYWSEKLDAVERDGRGGGYSQYSEEKMRQHVEDRVRDWIEENELDQSKTRELRRAVREEVLTRIEDNDDEADAREAVRDFSVEVAGETFQFSDSWEWSCEEFTNRFLWCCYALAWAINQYDAVKAGQAVVA